MSTPAVALVLTTYQKPAHLRRVLLSIALQEGVAGGLELVVADDGSTDETPSLVRQFASEVPFRVGWTTHPHTVFCPARSRNEGAAATSAPYLLFLDGDCLLPRDHVAQHLAHRAAGWAMVGDCIRLDEEESARLTDDAIRSGEYQFWGPAAERRRLAKNDRKFRLYNFLRHPRKPYKLKSGNVGIWRTDFERVNGFDENYRGWGCEDDDLGRRLRASGVRLGSVLRWTRSYHIWHPREATAGARWKDGPNVGYFQRRGRLTRCRNGLVKREMADLRVRVVGGTAPERGARSAECKTAGRGAELRQLLALAGKAAVDGSPEVEVVLLPGPGTFSRQAECNLLVVTADAVPDNRLLRTADVIVAPRPLPLAPGQRQFPLADLDAALRAVA